ncbi:MAG: META domain-containing protein [Pyrinomonadaceae bacterium]
MKNFTLKTISLLGLLILAVSAATAQRQSLANAEWKLTEAYGQRARQTNAMLDFGNNLTRFTGNGGCNQIFGSVSITSDRMRFGQIGATKRMCKMMAGSIPEETVLSGLNATRKYSVARGELTLMDNRGRVLMKFKRGDQGNGNGNNGNGAAQLLDDERWVLEQIANRQTYAPIRGVFINFDSGKRSVGGNTGCNSFGGTYTASRNTISMTDLISTMRACVEGGKMQTERELLDGLRRADTFEVRSSDNRLRLFDNGQLLLTFRGENK